MQADGQRDLAKMFLGNRGDKNDLYPSQGNRKCGETSNPVFDLPDGTWSGILFMVSGYPKAYTMRVNEKNG